ASARAHRSGRIAGVGASAHDERLAWNFQEPWWPARAAGREQRGERRRARPGSAPDPEGLEVLMRRLLVAIALSALVATAARDASAQCSIMTVDVGGTVTFCAGCDDEWQWSGPAGFTSTDMCV